MASTLCSFLKTRMKVRIAVTLFSIEIMVSASYGREESKS
jgi:hypothetical protein